MRSGVREREEVGALATRSERSMTALVGNYRDDEASATEMPVELHVADVPKSAERVLLRHYRIDQNHSNSYTVWKAMGSPQSPTPTRYEALKATGQLQLLESPRWVQSTNREVYLDFPLPGESVSLVELSW